MRLEDLEVGRTILASQVKSLGCWCGVSAGQHLWSGRYNRSGAVNYPYSIIRCANCGQVRTDPCPIAGETDSMYQGYGRSRIDDEHEVRRWFTSRVDDVRNLIPPPAKVLDVGCSTGTFVAMLDEAGYRAEGLEVDEFSVELAKTRGLRVTAGDLAHSTLDADSYDLGSNEPHARAHSRLLRRNSVDPANPRSRRDAIDLRSKLPKFSGARHEGQLGVSRAQSTCLAFRARNTEEYGGKSCARAATYRLDSKQHVAGVYQHGRKLEDIRKVHIPPLSRGPRVRR